MKFFSAIALFSFSFLTCLPLISLSPYELMKELSPEVADKNFEALLSEQSYFEIEEIVQRKMKSVSGVDASQLKVILAMLYLKDQRQEEAFKTFLQALHELPSSEISMPSEKELEIYNKALPLYLGSTAQSPQDIANELESRLLPELGAHPEYNQVRYLVASAYANKGDYLSFFYNFYTAYLHAPKCYMAYKTLAILHIKLFEKARTEEQKEIERRAIRENLHCALEYFTQDLMLYKLLLVFHSNEAHKEEFQKVFQLIMRNSVPVPKSELPFYIMQAIDLGEKELGERFLDKVVNSNQYSRTVEELRKLLQQR